LKVSLSPTLRLSGEPAAVKKAKCMSALVPPYVNVSVPGMTAAVVTPWHLYQPTEAGGEKLARLAVGQAVVDDRQGARNRHVQGRGRAVRGTGDVRHAHPVEAGVGELDVREGERVQHGAVDGVPFLSHW